MGIDTNLAYISKNNKLSYSQKPKVILDDKYYNYHKMWYFRWNYKMQDFKLAKKKTNNIK